MKPLNPPANTPYLEKLEPVEVSDVDLVYPARVEHLMPRWEDIPKEFQKGYSCKELDFFTAYFFGKADDIKLTPKEGIDSKKAWRHLRCILGSFQPAHEHKEAAVTYLLNTWFSDIKWERKMS